MSCAGKNVNGFVASDVFHKPERELDGFALWHVTATHIVPNLVTKYQLRNESLRRAILNLQSDATAHVFAHSVFDLDAGITMHVLLDAGVDLCRAYAEYAGITAALLSIYTL